MGIFVDSVAFGTWYNNAQHGFVTPTQPIVQLQFHGLVEQHQEDPQDEEHAEEA